MANDEFDDRYDSYVAHGSLGAWIETKEGVEHCFKVKADPSRGLRFSNRLRDRCLSLEAAKEIVVFRARVDYERLVSIIERIVFDHLNIAK